MKTKTLKLTAFLLITAGIFTACNEKESPIEPFLNIDKTSITACAEGGTFSISVSSNGEWTAVVQDVENNQWFTLTNDSGINDGVITVSVEENTFYAARSATVKVSTEALSKYVVINQEPNKNFPRDIPFRIFSNHCSISQYCSWRSLTYGEFPGFLTSVVINCNEELENNILCRPGYYHNIVLDFSKHTLLRVAGIANRNLGDVRVVSFRQYSESLYKLEIETVPNLFWWPWWNLALFTNKLSEGSEIKINVTMCDSIFYL